jgi:hypothetical protein
MTDSERALHYIEIFANAGLRDWKFFAPLDGEFVGEDRVRIGTVEVGPGEDDMWFLDDGQRVKWFRKAVAS